MRRLGILAGGGKLPEAILRRCQDEGRPYFLITFTGQDSPSPQTFSPDFHCELPLGAAARVVSTLHAHQVDDVVLAGYIQPPALKDIRPDFLGVKILAGAVLGRDDALLKRVLDVLARKGFTVRGAHEIVPECVFQTDQLGPIAPTSAEWEDIRLGVEAARELGLQDKGQAVIVKDGVVIGTEDARGTNALIETCAKRREKGGVLVKSVKPQQTHQADLPTIGPRTIELLARYGYAGLAVVKGTTLIVDQEDVAKQAAQHKLFVVGVDA